MRHRHDQMAVSFPEIGLQEEDQSCGEDGEFGDVALEGPTGTKMWVNSLEAQMEVKAGDRGVKVKGLRMLESS